MWVGLKGRSELDQEKSGGTSRFQTEEDPLQFQQDQLIYYNLQLIFQHGNPLLHHRFRQFAGQEICRGIIPEPAGGFLTGTRSVGERGKPGDAVEQAAEQIEILDSFKLPRSAVARAVILCCYLGAEITYWISEPKKPWVI